MISNKDFFKRKWILTPYQKANLKSITLLFFFYRIYSAISRAIFDIFTQIKLKFIIEIWALEGVSVVSFRTVII